MSPSQFVVFVVLLDMAVWTGIFFHERKEWDGQLAFLTANVTVIGVNVAIVCTLVALDILGVR